VNFDLSEEQRLLQSTAGQWFSDRFAPADMRRLLADDGQCVDRAALADMGFLGMLVDPAHGGGGLSVLDLAVVAEQAGRVLAPVPLVSTSAEAVVLLRGIGGRHAEALLQSIAAGRELVTLVDGVFADGDTVSGTSRPALGADEATVYLLLIGEANRRSLAQVRRGPDASPVSQPALDPTRAMARVRLEHARIAPLGSGGAVDSALARARCVAMSVLAAEDLGAAARCLELAVAYGGERVAFGRPVGSYQAIKHLCVDMFVLVEQLRSLVWFAAWAADHDPEQLPMAAAAAKGYAADAFERCAEACIQVHGGIGFTWEHDAHLFWRRAKVDRLLYGDAAAHRDVVAEAALATVS